MTVYDVIVAGTGGVGSAAAYHLAKRGLQVLGVDRFAPGHDRGSSHGHTRIIRKAYFEHPDYVPLLDRAYTLWSELEAVHRQQLYFPVGLIEIGPSDGVVVPGVLRSAAEHELPVDTLEAADVEGRFPGFVMNDDQVAVFERDAGYLLVEECVRAHAAQAVAKGAQLKQETVVEWQCTERGVQVTTESATYQAGKLVITAGAWAARLLTELNVSLRVLRKHLHWFACPQNCYQAAQGSPGFFYEVDNRFFYGFPAIDERGVKVAEHSGGQEISDPLQDDRTAEADDLQRVSEFMKAFLPIASDQVTDHTACYYTVSQDEHFVVDRHPRHPNVVLAAGLSGHGFKFASVLGEVLADLVTEGRSQLPIEFLSCERFGEAQ